MKVLIGRFTDRQTAPRLLARRSYAFHDVDLFSLDRGEGAVVMWATGAKHYAGSAPGEHDGLRDGGHSGHTDFSKVRVRYANLSDWLAAGYPYP